MNNHIKVVKSFVPLQDIENIYEYAKNNDKDFINYGNTEKEFKFNATFLDSSILELVSSHSKRVFEFVKENYPGPFLDFDSSKTHLAKFDDGYGMHEHFDTNKPNDIATLIYVNGDYLGGEIYFPDHDISIKPEPGDLVCFPDTPDFVHGVKTVSGGVRYTIPRWFTRIV